MPIHHDHSFFLYYLHLAQISSSPVNCRRPQSADSNNTLPDRGIRRCGLLHRRERRHRPPLLAHEQPNRRQHSRYECIAYPGCQPSRRFVTQQGVGTAPITLRPVGSGGSGAGPRATGLLSGRRHVARQRRQNTIALGGRSRWQEGRNIAGVGGIFRAAG